MRQRTAVKKKVNLQISGTAGPTITSHKQLAGQSSAAGKVDCLVCGDRGEIQMKKIGMSC